METSSTGTTNRTEEAAAPTDGADAAADMSGAAAASGPADGGGAAGQRRTAAEWAGLALLAVVVLLFGAFVHVFGPLLAISCSSCQDGVRSPLRFGEALFAVSAVAVPLTTLGTVVALFAARRGARAGGIGLCALLLLLLAEQLLGQFTG
ncbi:hypothetical protein JW613_31800 [Streptomyces smyrnaeus]|uniref:Uncharacterized protein n=1 Tax=Streptomyces smyrnaeus TaxID=1387713 RepID=A0ABS3Y589_9ACTN|nr:hypothetical protein [Streptomyces smyrnaeus]MBO8202827.1 hypothetical protein [Streptomyces smyrnaeus]